MTQRWVIDSNVLQAPALRAYLSEAPDNTAVIPDMVWVETYKQQSLDALTASFSIIGDFPDRVAILRSGGELARLDPTRPDLVDRMLHADAANRMRVMTASLLQAHQGEAGVIAQLAQEWSSTAAHVDGMLEGAADIAESLPEIADIFSKEEIRRCRTNERYTTAMFEKIFGAADQIYETLLEGHDATPGHMHLDHRVNAYLYRYALAIMIYGLWWIRTGSQIPKRLDRVRNDIIDLGIAVCGTYFNGLMTEDAKARWMHANLSAGLKMIGASDRG